MENVMPFGGALIRVAQHLHGDEGRHLPAIGDLERHARCYFPV
jgi:hypothetical protein